MKILIFKKQLRLWNSKFKTLLDIRTASLPNVTLFLADVRVVCQITRELQAAREDVSSAIALSEVSTHHYDNSGGSSGGGGGGGGEGWHMRTLIGYPTGQLDTYNNMIVLGTHNA